MRASNVRVVDPAKAPQRPYKPRLSSNIALGVFAGLIAGLALIVTIERADRTIQDPSDSTVYLNLPELGVIPADVVGRRHLNYRNARTPNGTHAPLPTQRAELITWERKPSIAAEAFRAALTSILFSSANGYRPKVLTLSSASPGEGKTTVACNLAIALAEIHQRVLLIDADMRKPRIHDIFSIPNDRGLRDLLMDRSGLGDTPRSLIRDTSIPGLFLLPSGPPVSNASNLLYSQRFVELIERFRLEFDAILIDTPPMLQMPDARVVGRLADAVILVIRAGKTTRGEAIAARRRFGDDSTPVLGTILNAWDPKKSSNPYSYTNTYRYKGYIEEPEAS
jgi:capsular exopolysaccharide synthesis family protein